MPELNSAISDSGSSESANTGSDLGSSPAGEQAPAASESSTQETTQLEVVSDGSPVPVPYGDGREAEAPGDDATEEGADGKAADDSNVKTDETKSEDQPREEKKRGREARIRQLAANERVYKDIIKSLNPDYDIDAAVKNGVSPADARMDAMEHNQARDNLSRNIAELNTDYQQQADEVGEKYPFMDASRTDRTEAEVNASNTLMDLWFQAAQPVFVSDGKGGVVQDGAGNLVLQSANVPLYDFVEKIMSFAEQHQSHAVAAAEQQGQRNAEHKIAAVEVPTPRGPVTDRSNDASLSAADYAEKHGLKTVS